MVIIDRVAVPLRLKHIKFQCLYKVCSGICCVVGDYGAPVTHEEVVLIEKNLRRLMKIFPEKTKDYIQNHGFALKHSNSEYSIRCFGGIGPCVFSENREGLVTCLLYDQTDDSSGRELLPISCSLFPIRIRKWGGLDLIDYEIWEECQASWQADVLLIDFCKKALIRRYGVPWFQKMYSTLFDEGGVSNHFQAK